VLPINVHWSELKVGRKYGIFSGISRCERMWRFVHATEFCASSSLDRPTYGRFTRTVDLRIVLSCVAVLRREPYCVFFCRKMHMHASHTLTYIYKTWDDALYRAAPQRIRCERTASATNWKSLKYFCRLRNLRYAQHVGPYSLCRPPIRLRPVAVF